MTPHHTSLVIMVVALTTSSTLAMYPNSNNNNKVGRKPYHGSYIVLGACQYQLCSDEYINEFGLANTPVNGSCSGNCDDLAQDLINSKFKQEVLWKSCADMCTEKYPHHEYR